MKCMYCNKEFSEKSRYKKFCSNSCYQKNYYQEHKETRSEYFKERHKTIYTYHPKTSKITEEEKKARRKAYYESHKEYYKQRAHEHYLRHKDEPEYRRRHNEASLRYHRRRNKYDNKIY